MAIGKRREFEVFTLSFLDCICCGFGAIILLLVLTDIGQPKVIERSEKDLKGQILDLQRQLFELRGETDVLERELEGRKKVLTVEQQKAAALAGDLSKIRGEFHASKGEASVTNIVETELVAAHQTLTGGNGAPAQELAETQRRAGGRRNSGRQRVDHLLHRHLGQHAERQLGERPERHEGNSRHLSRR
jgi:hypothetical protein